MNDAKLNILFMHYRTPMNHPLLARAHAEGTPLIDGTTATLIWQGVQAPYLKGDFSSWQVSGAPQPEKIEEGLWQYTLTLPEDAYLEYAFFGEVDSDDSRLPDPFNPRLIFNGVEHDNHYFGMPGYRATPLTHYQRGTARGKIIRHRMTKYDLALGKRRDLWLYQPPTPDPVPLLVVYDGTDYYRRARLNVIVDNLIARQQMAPVAMAMIDHAGEYRFAEYHAPEATLFTVARVYEIARTHLNLLDISEHHTEYGVMGASLGGLMALYTGVRMPQYVGKVLSQAGGFDICPAPRVESLMHQLVRLLPTQPLRIWQDCGTLDWLLESNRAMRTVLEAKGYDLTYREYNAGHNFTAWRDVLPEALTTLYPPV
jgi:enterochelin esterase-like enzyme